MITIHTPIISTANPDLTMFLHQIAKSNIPDKEEGYVVAFQDGEPIYIRKFGEFEIGTGDVEEPLCYDGLTGIKCYSGTGLVLFDKGEETNLSCFNKTAIKAWTKANWKDGVLIDWTKENHVQLEPGAMQATRESYDWK